MRTYITCGVKLIGLIFIYIGLMKIPRFAPWLDTTDQSGYDLYHIVYYVWPGAVAVLGGLVLFFKPKLIAGRIKNESEMLLTDQAKSLLKTGVILVGLYFLMNNLPTLLWFVWDDVPGIVVQPFWVGVSIVLKLYVMLIPLYLIFGSDRVVNWITRGREVEETA